MSRFIRQTLIRPDTLAISVAAKAGQRIEQIRISRLPE